MNKTVISIVIVAIIAVALATAGYVYAQAPTPGTPVPGTGFGQGNGMTQAPAPWAGVGGRGARGGMMGGGMMAGQNAAAVDQDGLLHDEMIAAYAQKLGISVEDLNARLAKGETMAQIASSKGLTVEQFRTLMTDARNQAIDQAVKNGTLTQAQADWMKQRGAGQMAGGMGNMRGMRGMGQGANANTNCPYYPQTQP